MKVQIKRNTVLVGILILNTLGILVIAYFCFIKQNQVYIDNISVFKQFDLTKELEKKKEEILTKRVQILVGMENKLDDIRVKIESNANDKLLLKEYSDLSNEYVSIKKDFEQENLQISTKFDNEIWTQLNQYIKDYGIQNNYILIFGVSGQGNIMYANDGLDATEAASTHGRGAYRRLA